MSANLGEVHNKDCLDCSPKREKQKIRQNLVDRFYEINDVPVVNIKMDPKDRESFLMEKPKGGRCNWETKITKKFEWYRASVSLKYQKEQRLVEFPESGIRKKSWCWSFDRRKPSMRVSLGKYDKHIRKNAKKKIGTGTLVFNNAKQDPALLRQCFTYRILRTVGIPAPRCNLAKIYLNNDDMGLYVNVEAIKKMFLKTWFSDASGKLIEIEGEDIPQRYVEEMNLRALLHIEDSSRSNTIDEIKRWVDIDDYIKFWAMETVLLHWDSYSNNRDNTYAYISPTDNKLRLIAWGADQSLQGNFLDDSRPFIGSYLSQMLFRDEKYKKNIVAQ